MQSTLSIVIDYLVFILVLAVSLGIGIFYSFRQKTAEEYVHGSHKLGLIPSSISMVVSFVSALTLQGIPAEIYQHGIEVVFTVFAALGMPLVIWTFLPIFYELKLTSRYEYLGIRFENDCPKLLGVWLNIMTSLMYSGITCLGPATAIETLTGIPTVYNIITMTVICMIYTSLGGIKAVIWTDVFQAAIMVIGMVVVIIMGFISIDVDTMWDSLAKYHKTDLHLDLKLTQRSSVWIFVFISAISRYGIFCAQASMIRYTSLPTMKQGKWSILISSFGFAMLMVLAMTMGTVVTAYYAQRGCGPLSTGEITTSNQIVPFFVVDVVSYPGLPGLFVSATVASTLSSISSAQNAIGTVFWKDILSKLSPSTTEFRKTLLLKLTVFVSSLISMGITFLAMLAGGTLFYASSVAIGVIASPPFGMFLLGATLPFAGATATFIGCICSILYCVWLSLGKVLYGTVWEKPTLINDMCHLYMNSSNTYWNNYTSSYMNDSVITSSDTEEPSGLIHMYSISAYAYPFIGTGLTYSIGALLSLIPRFRQKKLVDRQLLFPFLRRFVQKEDVDCKRYSEQKDPLTKKPVDDEDDDDKDDDIVKKVDSKPLDENGFKEKLLQSLT